MIEELVDVVPVARHNPNRSAARPLSGYNQRYDKFPLPFLR